MTAAFDSYINNNILLQEDGEQATPGFRVEDAKWIKEVISNYFDDQPIQVNTLKVLYDVSIGYISQRAVDLELYPLQDLLRQLNACSTVNTTPNRRNPLKWEVFVERVQANIVQPDVSLVFDGWDKQVGRGKERANYVIRDPLLSKNYILKKKDRELAQTAALTNYSKDTLLTGILRIMETRLSQKQKFEGTIAKKLKQPTQYEQVLTNILNVPSSAAAGVNKLPKEFFDEANIDPRTLIAISLACGAFYESEIPRIVSLAVERKAREKAPFADRLQVGRDADVVSQRRLGEPSAPGEGERQGEMFPWMQQARDERGRFATPQRELDLSSLRPSAGDNFLLDFISFEGYTKARRRIVEASMPEKLFAYVKQNGKKAIQVIWAGVSRYLKSKKIKPVQSDYQNFLKTGILKTKTNVPNNLLVPDIKPVFEVELEIDSSKERVKGVPVIYTIGVIKELSVAGGALEAKNLISLLQSFSENSQPETSASTYVQRAGASFAAATRS